MLLKIKIYNIFYILFFKLVLKNTKLKTKLKVKLNLNKYKVKKYYTYINKVK